MKKKIIAAVLALTVVATAVAAAAFGPQYTIEVIGGALVFMDGEEIEMRDVNGEEVEALSIMELPICRRERSRRRTATR